MAKERRGNAESKNSIREATVQRLQSMDERFGCPMETFPLRVFEIQPVIRSTADLLTVAIRECLTVEKQEN